MKPVYICATGSFLPGKPVANDEIENKLGLICDRPSRAKSRILSSNQIQFRHYALDDQQRPTWNNAAMATEAVHAALTKSDIDLSQIQYLATATTMPDILVPGFASMVHGELKNPPCELASFQSVCASSMMALKSAYTQIKCEEKSNAVVVASEFASRAFRKSRFEGQPRVVEAGTSFDTEFLRWMLSDGAGAVILRDQPSTSGLSLKIEWIDITSNADKFDVCMYMGGIKENGKISKAWLEFENETEAAHAGAFNLTQDIRLLDDVVKCGVSHFFSLIEKQMIQPEKIDHLLCHYSSHFFKSKIHDYLAKAGVHIPEERWYTNLYERGNTGSASIFIMLDEFLKTKDVKPGQTVLCYVPESGRFLSALMKLTVVGVQSEQQRIESPNLPEITAPAFRASSNPLSEKLVRQLGLAWFDFETRLRQTPIIQKIEKQTISHPEYKDLILNLRPQVTMGSLWISRLASKISMEHFALRSYFIEHALYGHKDYQMLDADFAAIGGQKSVIEAISPNLGTQALSAWMYQQAEIENPFQILGAMYIIEGMSSRIAPRWTENLRQCLQLTDQQMSFLVHHTKHEDSHVTGPIEEFLNSEFLTEDLVERVVRCAKVTAELYVLQFQMLNRY